MRLWPAQGRRTRAQRLAQAAGRFLCTERRQNKTAQAGGEAKSRATTVLIQGYSQQERGCATRPITCSSTLLGSRPSRQGARCRWLCACCCCPRLPAGACWACCYCQRNHSGPCRHGLLRCHAGVRATARAQLAGRWRGSARGAAVSSRPSSLPALPSWVDGDTGRDRVTLKGATGVLEAAC